MSDIKRETVEKMAEKITKNSTLSSEQAHKIARERAEKINQRRKSGKD